MLRSLSPDRTARAQPGGDSGASAPVPQVLYGVANISGNNYFTMAASGPTLGTASTCAIVWRQITSGNIVREYYIDRFASGVAGWQAAFIYDGTKGRAHFFATDGSPANAGRSINLTNITQNAINRSVVTLGSNALRVWRNGAQVGADATVSGYTPPTSQNFRITGVSLTTDEIELVSIAISNDTTLDVAAWDASVIAGGSRTFTGADYYWDAEDWDGSGDWTDRIAGAVLVKTGSPVKRTISTVVYDTETA